MFKNNVNSSQQPQQSLSYQTNYVPLAPKTTKITDEYEISNKVLGLGIVSVSQYIVILRNSITLIIIF